MTIIAAATAAAAPPATPPPIAVIEPGSCKCMYTQHYKEHAVCTQYNPPTHCHGDSFIMMLSSLTPWALI